MERKLLLLGVPAGFLGLLVAAAILRGRREESQPMPAKPTKAAAAWADPRPAALMAEKAPTQAETRWAAEEIQVRAIVQRLKEAAARGDEATKQAMIQGLRRWKGARTVLEEEMERTSDPSAVAALRQALGSIR